MGYLIARKDKEIQGKNNEKYKGDKIQIHLTIRIKHFGQALYERSVFVRDGIKKQRKKHTVYALKKAR